ncbi:MAG: DUF1847 domain-containing protein [Candidatus Hermodarchaeota archaeon]
MNSNSDNPNKMIKMDPTCYECDCSYHCALGKPNKELENCPIKVSPEIQKKAIILYETDEFIKKSNIAATIAKYQDHVPRLKDTIEYAKVMGFVKLGIASCGAFQKETKITADILNNYGFEVSSVSCPTGANKKIDISIPEEMAVYSRTGCNFNYVSCNPVAQALLLNKAKTDMNIIIGLCIGHDVTFTHLSEAPVTTLIAKDRVNRSNPAATLTSF